MDFADKVIIITGASSGIGAATAILLAKQGGLLTIVGRNIEKLNETGEKCKEANGLNPLAVQADLTKEGDVERIVQQTIENFGRIDVLINNAGVLETVPYLTKVKGCIVNVSSVNGIRSFPGVLAYNISKAALDQFTRCVALELAPKGVRCNSVNPGVIITEIHKRGGMDEGTYQKFLEHSKTTHALQRPGKVDEVSAVISFLASDKASFITGASLPVDGGRHAMCPR